MASEPYQSNLLRFLVSQYWHGLSRHQRAMRETRSTIVLGSEIGLKMTFTPIFSIVRASQKRLQKLRQDVAKLRLSAGRSQSAAMLDFSGFDSLLAISNKLGFESLQPFLKMLRTDEPVLGVHSVIEIDTFVGEVLLEETLLAETAMVQTLLSIGDCLSRDQIGQLTCKPHQWLATVAEGWHFVRTVISVPLRQRIFQKAEALGKLLENTAKRKAAVRLITGVASNCETQSLVLVIDHVRVWDGLTQTQQINLQQSIACFIENYVNQEKGLSFQPAVRLFRQLSVQAVIKPSLPELNRPLAAFWVAVLQVLGRLGTWNDPTGLVPSVAELKGLTDTIAIAPDAKRSLGVQPFYFLIGVVFGSKAFSNTPIGFQLQAEFSKSAGRSTVVRLMPDGMVRDRQALYVDADVVSFEYIEHPLEKLLKWVDRVLFWLEMQWAVLKAWLV